MSSFYDTPSSPLSLRSRSPTPPLGYPSPAPSYVDIISRSYTPLESYPSQCVEMDNSRPTKRRKLSTPKVRTTEYLDLRNFNTHALEDEENAQLERLMYNIRNKQKIVVIAGAGISVSAGIPDFRSSDGLFNTLKSQHNLKSSGKHLFDASVYKDDDSTTSFHSMVRDLSHMTRNASPTPFHHLLATLAAENRLLRLYSQNVDGIDTSMKPLATQIPLPSKAPWPRTIQLHGGLDKMVCTKCGELSTFDGELFDGPEPPSCTRCQEIDQIRTEFQGRRSHGIGKLRPRMVLYNEFNPDEDAIGAVSAADLRSRPDAVIIVGTTLKVPGIRRIAREMCQVTRGRRDGFTAWINYDPEPVGVEFKDCFDLVVRGSCDDVAQFVKLPLWNDTIIGDVKAVSEQEVEEVKARGGIKLEFPHRTVTKVQGMVTPTSSPGKQVLGPDLITGGGKQPQFVKSPGATVEKASSVKPVARPLQPITGIVKKASIKEAFAVSKGSVPAAIGGGTKPSYTDVATNNTSKQPRRPLPSAAPVAVIKSKGQAASTKKGRQAKAKSGAMKKQGAIRDAFSITKATPAIPKAKAELDPTSTIHVVSSTMQPISPRDLRNNSEPFIQYAHGHIGYKIDTPQPGSSVPEHR